MYNQQVRDTGFYQSKEWRKCRDGYFQYKHGLCERCEKPGKIVHHKKHLTLSNYKDPNISLNWDYLELLCGDCHNKEHFKKHFSTREDVRFNENGELVPV